VLCDSFKDNKIYLRELHSGPYREHR